jgi:DNA-binding response OmpR family regulator
MRPAKVLIADDIREIRDLLRLFLEPHYDVIIARNGEEAWELFNSERPDLVLTDVVMPRLTGLDLCARIKLQSFSPETPVVLVTAATRETSLADGFWNKAAGSDGFITKPFSGEQVLRKVRDCLRKASKCETTASEENE